MKSNICVCVVLLAAAGSAFAAVDPQMLADIGMHRNDEWRSVPVDRVRLCGPLGRRVAITATNNLMKIDLEAGFFRSFRDKTAKGGFIGLGKLLDGAAYLAKYTGIPEVVARKDEIARVLADTLTYFRTPCPSSPLLVDDELFCQ